MLKIEKMKSWSHRNSDKSKNKSDKENASKGSSRTLHPSDRHEHIKSGSRHPDKIHLINDSAQQSLSNFIKKITHIKPKDKIVQVKEDAEHTITIEYLDTESHFMDDPSNPINHHHCDMAIQLTGLLNGRFYAQLPLSLLPKGNVLIRITSYHMQILSDPNSEDLDLPIHYTYIQIPVFIDPLSMDLELEKDLILIKGFVKGHKH